MKKATKFNKTLKSLKNEIIDQIKVDLLVIKQLDCAHYEIKGSDFIVYSQSGNETVDSFSINWIDNIAVVTLKTETCNFELTEMSADDLLCFYNILVNNKLIITFLHK